MEDFVTQNDPGSFEKSFANDVEQLMD